MSSAWGLPLLGASLLLAWWEGLCESLPHAGLAGICEWPRGRDKSWPWGVGLKQLEQARNLDMTPGAWRVQGAGGEVSGGKEVLPWMGRPAK